MGSASFKGFLTMAIRADSPDSGAVGEFSVIQDGSGADLTQDHCSGVSLVFLKLPELFE